MSAPRKFTVLALAAVLALPLVPSATAAAAPKQPARVTADRPGTTGLRVHLVYMVAKGRKDRHYDTNGALARAADQLQAWFRRETGGRQMRLDTYLLRGKRVPDITFVRSPRTSFICEFASVTDTTCITDLVSSRTGGKKTKPGDLVQADLAAAGLKDPQVRYLVLVEGTAGAICGYALGPDDTDRDPSHVGHVSSVFLGDEFCPNDTPGSGGQVDWALAHEYVHGDGVVPYGAPHYCVGASGHVCTGPLGTGSPFTDPYDPERADILYPAPGIDLTDAHLDRGRDDYYGTLAGLRDMEDSPYLTPKP